MNRLRVALIALCLSLSALPASAAQSRSGLPQFRGQWQPEVGSGGVYQLEQKGQPAMTWEVAVVGQEAGGYWIENRMNAPQEMIAKMLLTTSGPQRFIVKTAGQPAMELPVMQAAQGFPETDLQKKAKLVGKEQVTTPAGTFSCDHYRLEEQGGTDVWVAGTVSPYGLVKLSSKNTTMTLSKVVKGAKTRITETPQKLEIPKMPGLAEMMGRRKE